MSKQKFKLPITFEAYCEIEVEAQTLNDLSLALLVITKNESTVQTYHSRTTSVEYYDKLISISGAFLVLAWILRRLYLKEFI